MYEKLKNLKRGEGTQQSDGSTAETLQYQPDLNSLPRRLRCSGNTNTHILPGNLLTGVNKSLLIKAPRNVGGRDSNMLTLSKLVCKLNFNHKTVKAQSSQCPYYLTESANAGSKKPADTAVEKLLHSLSGKLEVKQTNDNEKENPNFLF